MTTFTRPAVQVIQGNLTLYLTYLTPEDLFSGEADFYNVDELEPNTQEGFQRILNQPRAARLARHLREANPEGYAHLPTTVFLATDKAISFDETTGTVTFEVGEVCPFSVVDGQHRIEGLRRAFEAEESLGNFQLPVTIATELDSTHQMYHFFVVNTTQVPVDSSLRQQITRRFTEMEGVEDLPYTPHWLRNQIAGGQDARAIRLLEFLDSDSESPLNGMVQFANEPIGRNKIKQSSFVSVLKSEVLTASNPLSLQETDVQRQGRILLNYFKAIDGLFVDGRDRTKTVVYKSNGLFFFLGASKWIFTSIYSSNKDFRVESMKGLIGDALNNLDDEWRGIASADWWMPGGGGSSLNRALASRYIAGFQRALSLSKEADDITL